MSCRSAPVTARSRSSPARNGPAAERAHALRHREAVLEQPVPVGLVVVLRRRRGVVGGAGVGAPVDQAGEQRAQVRPLDRLHERVEVGGHLLVGHRRGLGEVAQLVLVLGGHPHPLHGHGRAVALVHRVAAQDPDDRARPGRSARASPRRPRSRPRRRPTCRPAGASGTARRSAAGASCGRARRTLRSSSWPSARSRTKHRVGVSVVCSIGSATVRRDSDGLASRAWVC